MGQLTFIRGRPVGSRKSFNNATPRVVVKPRIENLERRLLMAVDTNDQISEAALGTVGVTIKGKTIDGPVDVDLYKFQIGAGEGVFFDLDRTSGDFDSALTLFDSAGNVLSFVDDAPAPNETAGLDSYIRFKFNTAGTYFLGASIYPNVSYNPITGLNDISATGTGKYNIQTGWWTDPNDSMSEASGFPLIGSNGHRIERITDVDLFSVHLIAGDLLTVDLDRPAESALDSFLVLFDSNGTRLIASDDDAAPGESATADSYFAFVVPTTGMYFVGVSSFLNVQYSISTGRGDVAGSSSGAYALLTTVTDPDDQVIEARTITTSGTVTDSISSPTDVDLYAFNVSAGQKVIFDVDRVANSGIDSFLRLFNGSGTVLALNDNGPNPDEGPSSQGYLAYTFAQAGTYYVGVSGALNSSYFPFSGTGDVAGSTGGYVLNVGVDTSFRIEVVYNAATTPTASQRATITEAAGRWAQVIVGELPDVGAIDDLKISVSFDTFDGVDNILGLGSPTRFRTAGGLPSEGIISLDAADLVSLETRDLLFDLVLHEMGHVLGIGGPLWVARGLVTGLGTSDPRYVGVNARSQYNALFGTTDAIPVENVGGRGSVGSHWRESVLGDELMTSGSNASNLLSVITIGSLQDLGYQVNYAAADPYTRPGTFFRADSTVNARPVVFSSQSITSTRLLDDASVDLGLLA